MEPPVPDTENFDIPAPRNDANGAGSDEPPPYAAPVEANPGAPPESSDQPAPHPTQTSRHLNRTSSSSNSSSSATPTSKVSGHSNTADTDVRSMTAATTAITDDAISAILADADATTDHNSSAIRHLASRWLRSFPTVRQPVGMIRSAKEDSFDAPPTAISQIQPTLTFNRISRGSMDYVAVMQFSQLQDAIIEDAQSSLRSRR